MLKSDTEKALRSSIWYNTVWHTVFRDLIRKGVCRSCSHVFVVMLMHVLSLYAQNSLERLRCTSVSVTSWALGFGSPFELSVVFYNCTCMEIFPLTWFLSIACQWYWFVETPKLSVSITIWLLFLGYSRIVKL